MWPLKYNQNLAALYEMLPLRICTRHVSKQLAPRTCGDLKDEWQVTDKGLAIERCNQHPEGIALDERRYTLWICFREMLWAVHG